MAQTSVNIRMDEDLKRQFNAFCKDVGMTMTTAFNVFAKKTVKENRIPFEIGDDTPNSETIAAIKEVEYMRRHPEDYKAYSDVDSMMEDILR